MSLFKLGLAAALLGVAAASPVRAAPALEDPEATVVAELVVRPVVSGPAWWKVERGQSVVYVLGLPEEPLPKGLGWDQAVLKRRLAGADTLIAPVEPKAGLTDIPAFLRMRSRLKSHAPMEQGLPEPLRARFVAARTKLARPPGRYNGWDPILAGQILVNDLQDSAHTTRREPLGAIKALARRLNVPVRPAATFRVVGLLDPAVKNLTPQVSHACLAEALDEVELGAGALQAAGAAWARGDVQGVLDGPRGFAACLLLLSGGADFWRRTMAEGADAVAASLQKSGHAVAVFQLRSLLARDGVLSRLKARGFEVTAEGRGVPAGS